MYVQVYSPSNLFFIEGGPIMNTGTLTATMVAQAIENSFLGSREDMRLVAYFQPIVGRMCGVRRVYVEALSRIVHPHSFGEILYFPDAIWEVLRGGDGEEILRSLDWHLLEMSICQAGLWIGAGFIDGLTVNTPDRILLDHDSVQRIMELLERYAIPSGQFYIEVSEDSEIMTQQPLRDVVCEFARCGVLIGLDDVTWDTGRKLMEDAGTHGLPIHMLKLDRLFVEKAYELHCDSTHPDVLIDTIAMARSQKSLVVAEGIETKEQLEWILALYEDVHIQGYLVSRPVPHNVATGALMRKLW